MWSVANARYTMALTLNSSRSLISKKLAGAFIAIFALLIQPVISLNIPSAFAVGPGVAPIIGTTTPTEGEAIYKTAGVYTISAIVTDANSDIDTVKWALTGAYSTNSDLESSQSAFSRTGDTWSGNYALNHPDFPNGSYTIKFTATDIDGHITEASKSFTVAAQAPVAVPAAELSSTLPAVAVTGDAIDFSSTVTKSVGSANANIRVETEVAPSQAASMTFKYKQDTSYSNMPYIGGKYVYGPAGGFPLQTATSDFKVIFNAAGTYTLIARIIDAATNTQIGSDVARTVEVTAPSGTRYVATGGQNIDNSCTNVLNPCETIQHAINKANSGETVSVAAGSYNEAVSINKEVQLRGAQAGTDARTRTIDGAGETIVSGGAQTAFMIDAKDVSIDGFEVTQTSGASAHAINMTSRYSGVSIVNNIVARSGIGSAMHLYGGQDALVQYNYISGTSGNGIVLRNGNLASPVATNQKITDNKLDGVRAMNGGAIVVYGETGLEIARNDITTAFQGISVGATGPAYYAMSNVTVHDNTVNLVLDATQPNVYRHALFVEGNSENILVQNNTFRQSGVTPVANTRYALVRVSYDSVTTSNANPVNFVITKNNLVSDASDRYIMVGQNITNSINAENNWWGDDSNPSSKVNSTTLITTEPWLCVGYAGQLSPRQSVDGTCADLVGPNLAVTTPSTDITTRVPGIYTLTGTVSDSISGLNRLEVQIKDLDTDTLVLASTTVTNFNGDNWTFDVPMSTFVDGHQHSITFSAYDNSGNLTTVQRLVTVDNQAPVLSITNVTRNNDGTYTIIGSSNEALSSVQVSIDGSASQPATVTGSGMTWSFTSGVLFDGIYSIIVTANDTIIGNPSAQLPYTLTVGTPFTPVSQPVVNESALIVDSTNAGVTPVSRTTYVANVNTGSDDKGNILGTKTTKNVAKTPAQVIQPSEEGWKLWGMAWYWWVVLVGALGLAGWVSASWLRGRS